MGVNLLVDRFNGTGAIGNPWTVQTGDTWTRDGDVVQPLGLPSTFRRMIVQTLNPYAIASGSPPSGAAKMYEVEVQVKAPAAYSSTEELRAGIEIMSPGANVAGFRLEWVWIRSAAGAHTVELRFTNVAGVAPFTPTQLTGASIAAIAVGEVHTLRVSIEVGSQGLAYGRIRGYFDGQPYGLPQTLHAVTLGGTLWSTLAHYAGIVASTPGPGTGGPVGAAVNPVYPIGFDNFIVRDVGPLATAGALYPAPTLVATPTLTGVTLAAEDDSAGDQLPVQPSFAYVMEPELVVREHRMDGGHIVTHARDAVQRRRWQLVWAPIRTSDKDSLRTFHGTVKNRKAWPWTHPETGEAIKVIFASDVFTTSQDAANTVWASRAEVLEVF